MIHADNIKSWLRFRSFSSTVTPAALCLYYPFSSTVREVATMAGVLFPGGTLHHGWSESIALLVLSARNCTAETFEDCYTNFCELVNSSLISLQS